MKYSIMYDLYLGNFSPWEPGRPQDPEYASIKRRVIEIEEHFREILSPEEYEKLEEMEELQSQSNTFEDIQLFEYAFSMGILIMIEVFGFKERQIEESKKE